MLLTCISPTSDIIGDPQDADRISNNDSQLLYGETFQVEEEHGAYVYGYSVIDGYKGYVDREDLVKNAKASNAVITTRCAHLYPEPDFKSRPDTSVSFLSRVALNGEKKNNFYQTESNEWVYKDAVSKTDQYKPDEDLADIALKFLDTPYRYGGRSIFGIDCSGLLQIALMAKGHTDVPRDSKKQQGAFGKEVTKNDLQRNDIVFFKGHVGIMMDEKNILNATARHMTTLIEPLANLEKAYKEITHIARV
ncbi:MAG: NlpC/P60 family protein [Pseudomonadota bacterium]